MEEIAKIISAISQTTGLDRFSITYGRAEECKKARGILSYITLRDKYGLTTALSEILGKSRSQCIFMADYCKEKMEEDVDYLLQMNDVRKRLGMSGIMKDVIQALQEERKRKMIKKSERRSRRISKDIFGIEYSKSEEEQLKIVMQNAKAFMSSYCKIGRQADGRLTRCPY